jgi:hypothetical protein
MSEFDFGLPDVGYSGLTDTADGFTGSTTLQDTTVGQPGLLLDTSGGMDNSLAVTDMSDYTSSMADYAAQSQALSGATDPPIGSATQSVRNTNPPQPSGSLANAFGALAKFGSSFASALGGSPVTQYGAPTVVRPSTSTAVSTNASGSTVIILVIVVGAIILLLARSKGEE